MLSARVRADVPLTPFWAIAQTDALGQELRAQPVGSTPILASTSLLASDWKGSNALARFGESSSKFLNDGARTGYLISLPMRSIIGLGVA
jgi:hypothetical protein